MTYPSHITEKDLVDYNYDILTLKDRSDSLDFQKKEPVQTDRFFYDLMAIPAERRHLTRDHLTNVLAYLIHTSIITL